MQNDLTQLLDAIDAAYRVAVELGQKDVGNLLLMASLDVSQRLEADEKSPLRLPVRLRDHAGLGTLTYERAIAQVEPVLALVPLRR